MSNFSSLILAAGEGTRMKSKTTKVLHKICGRSMIDYVLEAIKGARIKKIAVVVNKEQDELLSYLNNEKGLKLVFQNKALGTGDAVKSAKDFLSKAKGHVLIICADVPLIKSSTINELIERHLDTNASCTILTAQFTDPSGFGRIVRDQFSKITKIVEENDANSAQKQIAEINSGIYCFKTHDLLDALSYIQLNHKKKEYYLTDVIQIMYEKTRKPVETCVLENADEILGINSRSYLAKAAQIMRLRIIENFLDNSVTIVDPKSTFIDSGVSIGMDTTVYPFTYIESNVKIGNYCSVGPFCHLREGTVLRDGAKLGNFSEAVRSTIGKNTLCKHLSYLGDVTIGDNVNIGAGTVIANYDGKNKNKTVIKDGAFIGSDTVIIAPTTIGKCAVTGAGSVVIKNSKIKDKSIVVGVPARLLEKEPKISKNKPKSKKRK